MPRHAQTFRRRIERNHDGLPAARACCPRRFPEATGTFVAQVRRQLRDEIQGLRSEPIVQRAPKKPDIIDLPALPLRRRFDAA